MNFFKIELISFYTKIIIQKLSKQFSKNSIFNISSTIYQSALFSQKTFLKKLITIYIFTLHPSTFRNANYSLLFNEMI